MTDRAPVKRYNLNHKFIEGLKPPAKPDRKDYPDAALLGFGVRVSYSNSKRFYVTYRVAGDPKVRRHTFKPAFPAMTYKAAKAEAKDILDRAKAGEDPRVEKAAAEAKAKEDAARTYGTVVDQFIEIYHRAAKGNKNHAGVRRLLLTTGADWLDRPVKEIGKHDIANRLEGIMLGTSSVSGKPA
ncbi:MAG: Arm DNA-binding domain-containing protein, partial [Alphaproteobacteria bacterium]|nr:Arm DNA-binding domain-containing protein [Alphaproteobacteria bacterium]